MTESLGKCKPPVYLRKKEALKTKFTCVNPAELNCVFSHLGNIFCGSFLLTLLGQPDVLRRSG